MARKRAPRVAHERTRARFSGHRTMNPAMTDTRARSRRRGRGESGVALVEFALVLPILAALMLGTITGGFALNQKQQVTHATREGARYAASIAPNQAFVSGTWAENVRDLVVERSAGDLANSGVCVSLVQGSPAVVVLPAASHSTAAGNLPCISGETYPVTANDTGLRVQVTGSKAYAIEFLIGRSAGVMKTQATAKSEQKL